MAVMERDVWTDKRLNDLDSKVDEGFKEMRGEFKAVRAEMHAGSEALRHEIREEFRAFRAEMKSEFQAVRAEISAVNRNLMHLTWGLIGTMLVGFLGTIVALVTQT
jgi:hypothetical protein